MVFGLRFLVFGFRLDLVIETQDPSPKAKVLFLLFKHPQHSISNNESTNYVCGRADDCDKTQDCADCVVVSTGSYD